MRRPRFTIQALMMAVAGVAVSVWLVKYHWFAVALGVLIVFAILYGLEGPVQRTHQRSARPNSAPERPGTGGPPNR